MIMFIYLVRSDRLNPRGEVPFHFLRLQNAYPVWRMVLVQGAFHPRSHAFPLKNTIFRNL